ncbi:MAG: BamA/TamA family outer membrane protein [Gemmatimonadetes bacterium]|nr:BamA/TamA family outer membrane protein [Gemmatimonadota bacterium]
MRIRLNSLLLAPAALFLFAAAASAHTVEVDSLHAIDLSKQVEVRFEEGRVVFHFRYDRADEAVVSGRFDGRTVEWPMRFDGERWTRSAELDDGDYEFRILFKTSEDEDWREQENVSFEYQETEVYDLRIDSHEIRLFEKHARHDRTTALGFEYNRVEGLRTDLTIAIEQGRRNPGGFSWTQGYAPAQDRWSWKANAEIPLFRPAGLFLTAEGYDRTVSHDTWTLSADENSAAALFLHEDFRDYTLDRGYAAGLAVRSDDHEVSVRYRDVESSPAKNNADWSLFGNAKDFRPNLFADSAGVAGERRQIEGSLELDYRNRRDTPTSGRALRLEGEYAGHELGGDFDYARGTAEWREFYRLGGWSALRLRVMGGAIDGVAPAYRRFYIGGIGTLRGHRFKELSGTRFFVTNIEYLVPLWDEMAIAFFTDIGDAWGTPARSDFDVESDMGIGLEVTDGAVRVDFARRADQTDADLMVTLRIQRMF